MKNQENESNPFRKREANSSGNTPNSSEPGGRNPRISSASWTVADEKHLNSIIGLVALERCSVYRNTGHLFVLPVTAAAMATLAGDDNKNCSLLLGLIGSKLPSENRDSRGNLLSISIVLFGIGLTFITGMILLNA